MKGINNNTVINGIKQVLMEPYQLKKTEDMPLKWIFNFSNTHSEKESSSSYQRDLSTITSKYITRQYMIII